MPSIADDDITEMYRAFSSAFADRRCGFDCISVFMGRDSTPPMKLGKTVGRWAAMATRETTSTSSAASDASESADDDKRLAFVYQEAVRGLQHQQYVVESLN